MPLATGDIAFPAKVGNGHDMLVKWSFHPPNWSIFACHITSKFLREIGVDEFLYVGDRLQFLSSTQNQERKMIAPAPHMPANLARKLIIAVRSFQSEYDGMTFAEARRLLARHDFRVPVLCSLVFHGNGKLKHVNVRENLKRKAPYPRQFDASVRIFASPEQGAMDLRSGCFRWIAEDEASRFLAEGRHQAFRLSDAHIAALLRRISVYAHYKTVDFEDVSLLAIRRIVEKERDLRCGESNHARLSRHVRPVPPDFMTALEEERAAALAWRDEEIAKGYTHYVSFEYRGWPEEEGVVLAHRARAYRFAFR